MRDNFAKNLIFLRKEKGLSQKKVSEDLGISQALLSHYEKGIRECGLEFLVKTAAYFEVSVDFLLGLTENRSPSSSKNSYILTHCSKNPISSAVNILFALLKKINSKSLAEQVTNYLSSAVYTIFRIIYSGNEKNSQDLFSIDKDIYSAIASSYLAISKAKCRNILSNNANSGDVQNEVVSVPQLNANILKDYGEDSEGLFYIIDKIESSETINNI